MIDNVIIKIKNISIFDFFKTIFYSNIDITLIESNKNYIICKINAKDLKKLRNIYKCEVIKDYSYKQLFKEIKNKFYYFLLIIFAVFIYFVFINIIVDVNIESNNKEMIKIISKELEENNISRLKFKKNFVELNQIKEKILNNHKDVLEWLEIQNIGMTYTIKFEERKSISQSINEGYCNVIAAYDGMITKIISTNGVVLVKNNQMVKENDLLISGQIMLNDETKANICAKGLVFAEKWYNVTIDMPIIQKKKRYTKQMRYNLLFSPDNRDYKIFKSRFKDYDTDKKEIISFLGKKLYLLKEYEYVYDELEYNNESLDKKINELIEEKLELSLRDNERILSKNVLKKEANDSRIKIELFVTIERLISKQQNYTLD